MIPYQLSTVQMLGLWGLAVSVICVAVLIGNRINNHRYTQPNRKEHTS